MKPDPRLQALLDYLTQHGGPRAPAVSTSVAGRELPFPVRQAPSGAAFERGPSRAVRAYDQPLPETPEHAIARRSELANRVGGIAQGVASATVRPLAENVVTRRFYPATAAASEASGRALESALPSNDPQSKALGQLLAIAATSYHPADLSMGRELFATTVKRGGATVDAAGNAFKGTGYLVADPAFTATVKTPEEMNAFINSPEVRARLAEPGAHLGTWKGPDGIEINVSDHVPRAADAHALGLDRAQQALGQFENGAYKADVPVRGNPLVHRIAKDYVAGAGFPSFQLGGVASSQIAEPGRELARVYAGLTSNPNDPAVRAAYDAFTRETAAQGQALRAAGIHPEFVTEDPYRNSAEMMADVAKGKIKVFKTPEGAHPLLTPAQNDEFRFVHDVLGHARFGNQFGPYGEELAYRAHAPMYSPEARAAMATETRGQNSFVNFSPGAEALPPSERPFAPQKAALLPPAYQGEYSDFPNALDTPTFQRSGSPLRGRLIVGEPSQPDLSHVVPNAGPPTAEDYARFPGSELNPAPAQGGSAQTAPPTAPSFSPASSYEALLPHLSEEMGGSLQNAGKRVQASAARIYAALNSATPVEALSEAMKAGAPTIGGYARSARALQATFGADAPQFTRLMAALSPQQSVEKNLRMALNVWNDWQNTPEALRTPETVGQLLARNARYGDTGGKVLEAHRGNAIRALLGTEPEAFGQFLSGPKVNSFYRNLLGQLDPVTLDTHQAQLENIGGWGKRYLKGPNGPFGTFSAPYLAGSSRVTAAAKALGLAPAEGQEAGWSWLTSLLNEAGGAKSLTDKPEGYLAGLAGEGVGQGEQAAATWPGLDVLLNTEHPASILERGGLTPPPIENAEPLNLGAPDPEALKLLARNAEAHARGRYLLGLGLLGLGLKNYVPASGTPSAQ